jgi:hypothetical protein
MNKKLVFSMVLFFFAGLLFAENRTGKVVHIETASSMGAILKYIYLDSNDDKIIDAIIVLGNSANMGINSSVVFAAYIKVGSNIVFNYNREMVRHGIFYVAEDNNESIVSIGGIVKSKLFAP